MEQHAGFERDLAAERSLPPRRSGNATLASGRDAPDGHAAHGRLDARRVRSRPERQFARRQSAQGGAAHCESLDTHRRRLADHTREGAAASDPSFKHAGNFLLTLNDNPPEGWETEIFDTVLILYADHEFNASTFSARVTASTMADIYAAVTTGIGTLKGSLHGGANEESMQVLQEIGSPSASRRGSRSISPARKRSWASAIAFTNPATRVCR